MNKLFIAIVAIALVAGIWTGAYWARREMRLVQAVNNNSSNIQLLGKGIKALEGRVVALEKVGQTGK